MIRQTIVTFFLGLSVLLARTPEFPFLVQAGTPVAIQNFIQAEAACNWDGIGGQVFDGDGQPVTGLVIRIYGMYDGAPLYANVLTGVSLKLGPGGYEYQLGNTPLSSSGQLTIQVFNLMGEALSYPVVVNTQGACDRNLLLVNFVEVDTLYDVFLSLIHH